MPGLPDVETPDSALAHVAVVDDDKAFLQAISANLQTAGYRVTGFGDPVAALAWLTSGAPPDACILDWNMPRLDGITLLQRLRAAEVAIPVMMLTSLREPVYEELAFDRGAVEFVEKTRSPAIILRRLAMVLAGRGAPAAEEQVNALAFGALELKVEIKRAQWKGQEVKLSMGEFQVVWLLVSRAGADASYREIYDQMRGDGFLAGQGEDGYRANVRAMIKRIRAKFQTVDPGFDALENYAGFGYRWRRDG